MLWISVANVIVQSCICVILLLGFGMARLQLRAAANANKATNFFDLVSYLQRPEIREARSKVLSLGADYSSWKDDQEAKKAAQQVASSFDIAAVAMKHGLIDAAVFSEPWKTSVLSTFVVLREFVADMQRQRGDDMYFAHYVGLARYLDDRASGDSPPYGVQFL